VGYRQWPQALRQRLGDDGVAALASVFEERDQAVLNLATERFERRLAEECAKLRAEIGRLRTELREQCALLRAEFRIELAGQRADFIKWSFLFWAGQAVTIAGLLVALR
jgi:hypothetical protein